MWAQNFDTFLDIENPWETKKERDGYLRRSIILAVCFGISSTFLLISIVRTVITSPGHIPEEKEWDMVSESMGDSQSEDLSKDKN